VASPASRVSRSKRIRVLVADGTPMGCQLIEKALGSHPRIAVAATACSARELADKARQTAVDSALVDVNLQEGHLSGLRAIAELHAAHPRLPIITFCDRASDDLVIGSFRAGARGLLCRSESVNALAKCIQAVHNGQIWANSSHLNILLGAITQAVPARALNAKGLDLLAEREGQVVDLVADGLTNRDIAARLGLSEHTVSNYLFRIYNKLGVSSRVELVLYVMKRREQSRIAS
jgi:two-component system nitrate/nitrite response regulator NarL